MTLPFLNIPLTTTHCLIGVGSAVGVPIVGYGGYCIHDSSRPTSGKKLKGQGYKWDLPNPSQLDTSLITESNKWKLPRLGCFQKFFPGATATQEVSAAIEKQTTFNADINISNNGKDTDPIGCILSKIDWTDQMHFTYKSEIAIKNDNFGWVIWDYKHQDGQPIKNKERDNTIGSGKVMDYDFASWTYHILFLEKQTSGNWEVKGGYYLADLQYYGYSNHKVSIVFPGRSTWTSRTKSATYSGVWLPNSQGEEVFENMQVKFRGWNSWMGKRRGNGELFGAGDNYFRFNAFYSASEQKWKSGNANSIQQLSDKIEKQYEPFKGHKGKWHTTSSYCNRLSKKESLSSKDEERLKLLCYKAPA